MMNPDNVARSIVCWMLLLMTLLLGGTFAESATEEWPQYRGANRDGISRETGLPKSWPANGPEVMWKVPVGDGYSGIAIKDGRLYTMDAKDGSEFVVAFDAASGKELWRYRADAIYENEQGNGPRATPTIDGSMVYAFGALATLHAVDAATGKRIWSHDLKQTMNAKVPIWGVSASPLIEGEKLIVPVGGGDGNAIVCFNKKTGAVMWKSQSDEPGYSSPVALTIGGARQIIAFSGTALFSVSPATGKLLWKYPWKTDWFVNAATPIFIPDDKIFISSGYDRGAALLRVRSTGGMMSAEEVWLSKGMKNHFNSSILHGGHLYGFDNSVLKCVDAATGEEKWKKSGFGKGSLMLADGHLYVLSERGQLLLIEATPNQYVEKASAQVLQGKCWTMPTLAGKKLYLRNQKEMICLNLGAQA